MSHPILWIVFSSTWIMPRIRQAVLSWRREEHVDSQRRTCVPSLMPVDQTATFEQLRASRSRLPVQCRRIRGTHPRHRGCTARGKSIRRDSASVRHRKYVKTNLSASPSHCDRSGNPVSFEIPASKAGAKGTLFRLCGKLIGLQGFNLPLQVRVQTPRFRFWANSMEAGALAGNVDRGQTS